MSQSADNNFVTSFDTMVKQAYQGQMMLRDTVRLKTGVVGSTYKFPKLGSGVATPRIPQTDVVPMNVAHSSVTATMTDWNAAEYSDVYDLQKLNFDEKQELAKVVGAAMGRRCDQIILDAAAAGASATTVATSVGGSNTSLNLDKILRAKRLMDQNNVPNDGRRTFVAHASALENALLQANVTSGDYNILRPLMDGTLTKYAGFNFKIIGDRAEGGLDLTSTTRTNIAYHQDSVGLAIGMDMKLDVNYIPEKTSWLINELFSAGAAAVDQTGIYKVLTYET